MKATKSSRKNVTALIVTENWRRVVKLKEYAFYVESLK